VETVALIEMQSLELEESPHDYPRTIRCGCALVIRFFCRILNRVPFIEDSRAAFTRGKTTVNNDLLTLILPLYSIKPSFLNLFMKKFTRERVVPIMLARVSWETFGSIRTG